MPHMESFVILVLTSLKLAVLYPPSCAEYLEYLVCVQRVCGGSDDITLEQGGGPRLLLAGHQPPPPHAGKCVAMKMSAPAAAAPAPTLHTAATTGKPDTTTNHRMCLLRIQPLHQYRGGAGNCLDIYNIDICTLSGGSVSRAVLVALRHRTLTLMCFNLA